jgi:hypothetical protein
MRVVIGLTGVTGLVMHNIRLADGDDPIVRAIKEITARPASKRTDAENAEIARLEWHGGLYHDPEVGVHLPSWNVVKCFERAGTITRMGSTVVRGVAVTTDKVPIKYDGPRPEFRFRAMVGVQRDKVPRMRPIFRRWGLELEAELLEDVLNPKDFERIVAQAGRSEGLGDARKLGYGRFVAEVAY